MSEFFISKKTKGIAEEVSIFHVPETDDTGAIVIPERVMRAQGRTGLLGLLKEWKGTILHPTESLDDMPESIEPVSVESAVAQIEDFMRSHIPLQPLEFASELPEALVNVITEKGQDQLRAMADGLGLELPDSDPEDDGPTLYTGQYL